jgi:murein DD-endopeptidase MepM/ murein hydrolase activator NlpD
MKAIVVGAGISLWANAIHALEKLGLSKTIRSAIGHDDGTAELYGHITHDGAAVKVGDFVRRGDLLGRSGNDRPCSS